MDTLNYQRKKKTKRDLFAMEQEGSGYSINTHKIHGNLANAIMKQ